MEIGNTEKMSEFAKTIMEQKYSHVLGDGTKETWNNISYRVSKHIMKAVNAEKSLVSEIREIISKRQFLPGGRYLYAAGRPYHQTQNCLLLRAEDSREGWSDLMQKSTMALMTGAGIGVDYSIIRPEGSKIRKTGGTATGPLALMQMVNEAGRGIMQGGARRSAIWAGLSWKHQDVHKFVTMKNWSEDVKKLKENNFNFPAMMDGTNISVLLDDEFFKAYHDEKHPLHSHAHAVYWAVTEQMLKTAEPGFSIDVGENKGETLRNACTEITSRDDSDICLAEGTRVKTKLGYKLIENITLNDEIASVVDGTTIYRNPKKVVCNGKKDCLKLILNDERSIILTKNHKVLTSRGWIKAENLTLQDEVHVSSTEHFDIKKSSNEEYYSLGWLVGDGWFTKNSGFGFVFGSKEDESSKIRITNYLNTLEGANPRLQIQKNGVQCLHLYRNKIKEEFKNKYQIIPDRAPFKRLPSSVFTATNEEKCSFLSALFAADGSAKTNRRCVVLASASIQLLKDCQLLLDSLGIYSWVGNYGPSSRLSISGEAMIRFFNIIKFGSHKNKNKLLKEKCEPYVDSLGRNRPFVISKTFVKIQKIKNVGIHRVYDICMDAPYHHFVAEGMIVHNCNLGSINMSRINSLEEMKHIVELATAFLLAGTVYSDVPYTKVDLIRSKNRRLGLGLLGLHEWLLLHGKKYAPDNDLKQYLSIYSESTQYAEKYAKMWDLSVPVKTRAIAPTGCQSLETMVITEDGILELKELGNCFGQKWQPLNITVAQETANKQLATRYFVNGLALTKKIELSSGCELECTPNHRYRILTDKGNYIWKRADKLKIGDKLVVLLNSYDKKTTSQLLSIMPHYRTEQNINMPTELTPELCKFLGIFYGDGSMHSKGIRIACNAKETKYLKIGKLGQKLFNLEPRFEDNGRNCMSVVFSSSVLLRWLYTNGLNKPKSKEMEIPAIIRCASRKSLEAFIEGYWDADGYKLGENKKYVATASKKMANQLQVIIRALGNDCRIQKTISGFGFPIFNVHFIKTRRTGLIKYDKIFSDLNLKNCTVDEVISISDSKTITADIEVPITFTYIANSIISHNTIGIVAETTTGIEPIFCAAYKRRYKKGSDLNAYQYVLDPTAKKLVDMGISPDDIEDAYSLSDDVERRISFQTFVQEFVDHSISSTVNLPSWGSETNNQDTVRKFGDMLINHLPKLRGITCYPDGARGGQPLTPIKYSTASKHIGQVFIEQADVCDITKAGSCGS